MPKQEKIEYLRQFPGIENDPKWKAEMDKEGITLDDLRQPQPQANDIVVQETPEEPGMVETQLKGAAAGAVKGLTKNWYDDAYGSLAALAQSGTGNPYMPANLDAQRFQDVKESKAKEARDVVEGAAEAAPIASGLTELVGQGVTDYYAGGALAKAISPVSKLFSPAVSTYGRAIKGKPIVSAISKTVSGGAQGATIGALSGAVTGAGTATGDKLEGALSGAETGAIVGAGAGLVGGAIGAGRDVLAKRAAGEEVAEKVQGMAASEIKDLKNTPINERMASLVDEAMPVRESAFNKASEEAATIKNTLAETTKEIGTAVNKGKVSAAKEILDKQPLIETLQSTLPSLEGGSKKLVKSVLKTLEKPAGLSVQKAERIANVLENNAKSAPSTVAPLLKDLVGGFRSSVKAALPEATSELIEGTKDILSSQIPKAAKKISPEKFVKVLTSKGNEFSTKKAIDQARTVTGKELSSFKSIKGTADLLRKIPTEDPAAMEAFLVKSLQYEAQLAKGVIGDALKTQGERDFYELLAKTGSIKDALLNLRAAFAVNPKLAQEYFQRKSTQGAIELAKGNIGNAASNFFQANSGGFGGVALRSYGSNVGGQVNRLGRALADTTTSSEVKKKE